MQIRGKWTTRSIRLEKGDIVIIKDECLPPAQIMLSLVIEMHPGKDDVVRVFTLRLGSGAQMKRSVVELCILPTNEDCSQL